MSHRRTEVRNAVTAAVREYPEAKIKFGFGGKHLSAQIFFGDRSERISLSSSPSDINAFKSAARDAYRALDRLGATFVPRPQAVGPSVIKMRRPLLDFEPLTDTTLARPRPIYPPQKITLARALGLPEPEPVTQRVRYSEHNSRRHRRRVRCWLRHQARAGVPAFQTTVGE